MQLRIGPDSWDGQSLRKMFGAAGRFLRRNVPAINALNVFPVPDGDTGTNMLLTLEAALERANLCPDHSCSAVAKAMAEGALMGARGNSGVILSQIFRGLAQEFEGRDYFSGKDFARALGRSTELAYKAVSHPVEGTMLTVLREASEAASSVTSHELLRVMERVVQEAQNSVARTSELLPVLRESGVVDAGGQGLYMILEGILHFLKGEKLPEEQKVPAQVASEGASGETRYGYCTEFLLQGEGLRPDEIRKVLAQMGESVMVVGDENLVRVHLHTLDPGSAISYGTRLGTLKQVKIENMDEQHRDFLTHKTPAFSTISIVAVVSGEGLTRVFESLGALVVPGGETMNPSVKDMLHVVEWAPTDEVVILPNNSDVLPVAHQVRQLCSKRVEIIPSKTIPQGIAAILSFDPERDLKSNVKAMQKGLSSVRTGEITTAVRSMHYKGLSVKKGQCIGFLDGELIAAGENREQVLQQLLSRMNAKEHELFTLYYGSGVSSSELDNLSRLLRRQYPNLQIEMLFGGQLHYDYIISLE